METGLTSCPSVPPGVEVPNRGCTSRLWPEAGATASGRSRLAVSRAAGLERAPLQPCHTSGSGALGPDLQRAELLPGLLYDRPGIPSKGQCQVPLLATETDQRQNVAAGPDQHFGLTE